MLHKQDYTTEIVMPKTSKKNHYSKTFIQFYVKLKWISCKIEILCILNNISYYWEVLEKKKQILNFSYETG